MIRFASLGLFSSEFYSRCRTHNQNDHWLVERFYGPFSIISATQCKVPQLWILQPLPEAVGAGYDGSKSASSRQPRLNSLRVGTKRAP